MKRINIRRATATDWNTVYKFVSALEERTFDAEDFRNLYQQNSSRPEYYYLIAEAEGTPVGFISLHTQVLLHHGGRTGEIQELYVEESHRGKGVGQRLLADVEKIAIDIGLLEIEITAHLRRTVAHRFYQRHGYTHSHLKFTKTTAFAEKAYISKS